MELQDMKKIVNKEEVIVDEEEGPLPGFRFHPTDEELVSFYLKRKVQKRPISIEIIKQIDIYKHDPWELAKASSVGDKEWYFYCKRGRKYRNSIRPNRVIAGSGFWKATGIDKPVYLNAGEGDQCVGLKKSLVYYRGCAGKGTKTEWMMHEFRLPTDHQQSGVGPNDTLQEAEVWTLCRIFKRNRKYTPNWRDLSAKSAAVADNNNTPRYIASRQQQEPYVTNNYSTSCTDLGGLLEYYAPQSWMAQSTPSDASNFSSPLNPSSSVDDQGSQFLAGYGGNWDDLSSMIEFATRSPLYEGHV